MTIEKFKNGKLVRLTMGESLLESIIEGARILLEHHNLDGIDIHRTDFQYMCRLKYSDQGKAIQRYMRKDTPEGERLKHVVETYFRFLFGRQGDGELYQAFINQKKDPEKLPRLLRGFKRTTEALERYAQENKEQVWTNYQDVARRNSGQD